MVLVALIVPDGVPSLYSLHTRFSTAELDYIRQQCVYGLLSGPRQMSSRILACPEGLASVDLGSQIN